MTRFIFDLDTQRDILAGLRARLSCTHQQTALDGWCEQVQSTGVFVRGDIMRTSVGRAASVTTLVDLTLDRRGMPTEHVHRIEGRSVTRFFGSSEGQRFAEVYDPVYRCCIEPAISEAVTSHIPRLAYVATDDAEGTVYPFRQLLLPVADPQGVVRHVLSVYDFRLGAKRFPDSALSIHTPLTRAQDTRRRSARIMGLTG